jgi:hypothetical protein
VQNVRWGAFYKRDVVQGGRDVDYPKTFCVIYIYIYIYIYIWRNSPEWSRLPHYGGITITLRHSILGRTSLDEWSARRRDLTAHNTQQDMYIHTSSGIRTCKLNMRTAADPRLRPRGRWDWRHLCHNTQHNFLYTVSETLCGVVFVLWQRRKVLIYFLSPNLLQSVLGHSAIMLSVSINNV